jgi:predicted nucleic acid-binding protein
LPEFGSVTSPLRRSRRPIPPLLVGAWERRYDLELGDALYLELARSLGLTMITTDPKLAAATSPLAELVGRGG